MLYHQVVKITTNIKNYYNKYKFFMTLRPLYRDRFLILDEQKFDQGPVLQILVTI